MDFNEYQEKASRTWTWIQREKHLDGFAYLGLGLGAESGEVLNNLKKVWRDDGGVLTSERYAAIVDELGDVLWYATMLARTMGTSLEEIAIFNIEKLEQRHSLK